MATEESTLQAAGQAIPYVAGIASKAAAYLGEVHLENPKMLLLFFPAILLFVYPLRGEFTNRKKIYLATRLIIVLLLLVAAASPYTYIEDNAIQKKSTITVLVDTSESMAIFPNSGSIAKNAFEEIKEKTAKYTSEGDIRVAYFGGGNRTPLWDSLYQAILGSAKEHNVIVLVSDGVSNHGKELSSIARLITESNTTIYPILPGPSYADISIKRVVGATKTPVASDYELLAEVKKTGVDESRYDLRLFIDGERKVRKEITQGNETEYLGFTLKFEKEGIRRIDLEVAPAGNDFYAANNNFTKIVEVVEQPKILMVSKEPNSPLAKILKKLYKVDERGTIPRQLSEYSATYIDNVEAHHLNLNIEVLRDYVTDGNGLVVVGGNNSYDRGGYNSSLIENLLPVRSRDKPKEKRKPVTSLFLLDISGSGQYTGITETTINLEKALAVKLIKELDLNDSLGVIAFNVNAFPVSSIDKVDVAREEAIDRILRLKAGGDTDMVQALEMADDFLKLESNERVIVLFSDGIIRLTRVPSSVDALASLTKKGVKVYIVGVGKDNVGQSTLKYLATQTGALYFEPEEYQRLKLSFTREGQEEEGAVGVDIQDPHHFITRNLKFAETKITDYNNVREKLNAQVLVSTEGGSPVLTVWRFGLGRVASLSTDDGLTWAQDMYSAETAKMIPSLTNWVIGDIEGRKDTVVEAEDSFMGDSSLIISRSSKIPLIKIRTPGDDEEEFHAKRIGLNIYAGEYHPSKEGTYFVTATSEDAQDSTGFAVNYPKEYTETGVDLETLGKIARLSQGKLYTSGEAIQLTQDVIFDVKERAEVKSKEKKPLTLYFLVAAIAVYFLDAASRRITEIMRLTRG